MSDRIEIRPMRPFSSVEVAERYRVALCDWWEYAFLPVHVANEIERLQRRSDALDVAQPVMEHLSSFLAFVEASRELDGEEPLTGHEIIAHFMGHGASDSIRVADLQELQKALTAIAAAKDGPA